MVDKQQVRADIREFLTTRRARVTPEQAGLRVFGSSRRVAGLRREEVAALAGISAEYYTRLERGNVTGASDSVLDGDLDLPFEGLPLPADPGQYLVVYSAEPDTASYAALQILASWAARPREEQPAADA
jgi:transcriptional regulator with XRE-family HTH domain